MHTRFFVVSSVAACLVVARAHAGDDATLHVTGGPAVLVQSSPTGWVELCKTPCDVRANRGGVFRFLGAPGSDVRASKPFVLPSATDIDLNVNVSTQSGRRTGFIVLAIGATIAVAGIVFTAVGVAINNQSPGAHDGDPFAIGGVVGIIAGIVTLAIGYVEAANNRVSWVTATPTTSALEGAPRAAIVLPAPQAFALPLFSVRF